MRSTECQSSSYDLWVRCCVSPRESEWDADVSHGSRESQLSSTTVNKMDWGGGPSYGVVAGGACGGTGGGGGRDYSMLSPAMPRKGSVVTFDVGEPGARRHSSPIQPVRRKNAVVACSSAAAAATALPSADCGQPLAPALKYAKNSQQPQLPSIRYIDDYRTLTQLRKRSAGDQSIISIRIDEDDSGEEEEGREDELGRKRTENGREKNEIFAGVRKL